jgi:hypothetical protein
MHVRFFHLGNHGNRKWKGCMVYLVRTDMVDFLDVDYVGVETEIVYLTLT